MTSRVSSLRLEESTANPEDDVQAQVLATIPDILHRHSQNAPILRYNQNISKKRPWNQPDLTFTLKRSSSAAADGSSSSSSSGSRTNRSEIIKYPRSQNALNRNGEDQKEENENEDDKVEQEGKDQNEEEEDDDTTKEETTQIRNKTKRTRVQKKAKTKTKKKKKRTMRKKKRRYER